MDQETLDRTALRVLLAATHGYLFARGIDNEPGSPDLTSPETIELALQISTVMADGASSTSEGSGVHGRVRLGEAYMEFGPESSREASVGTAVDAACLWIALAKSVGLRVVPGHAETAEQDRLRIVRRFMDIVVHGYERLDDADRHGLLEETVVDLKCDGLRATQSFRREYVAAFDALPMEAKACYLDDLQVFLRVAAAAGFTVVDAGTEGRPSAP